VRRRLLLLSLVLAVLTVVAMLTIDRPLAHALAGRGVGLEGFFNACLRVLEYATLFVLPKPYFAALVVVVSAGLAISPRTRPLALKVFYIGAVLIAVRYSGNAWKEVFASLRPRVWLTQGGDVFFRGGHAFPSGHATHFAAVCASLAILWPRIARWLLVVPVFVAIARVTVNDHFVSDVLGGFAWGTFVAALLAYVVLRTGTPRPAR
jgi:membrane-associated phospholipid phosphatase